MVLDVFQILIIFVVQLSYFVMNSVEFVNPFHYFLLLRFKLIAHNFAVIQRVIVGTKNIQVFSEVFDELFAECHVYRSWLVFDQLIVLNQLM